MNKFYVSEYRLNTIVPDILVVRGWFSGGNIGANKIMAFLDGQRLPVKIKTTGQTEGSVQLSDELTGKQYFFYIKLPGVMSPGSSITFINKDGSGKSIRHFSGDKLRKSINKLPGAIMNVGRNDDTVTVSGWFVSKGEVEFRAIGDSGELETEVSFTERRDIEALYPECHKGEVRGFIANVRSGGDSFKLALSDSDKTKEFKIKADLNTFEKQLAKVGRYSRKLIAYYRSFGGEQTMRKILEKLSVGKTISYPAFRRKNKLTSHRIAEQRAHVFQYAPKISVVVPLYHTPKEFLRELIESLEKQTYQNWELCLSDGSGEGSPLTELLNEYREKDSRIVPIHNNKRLRIAENTNAAIEAATGEFIGFADHDDLLTPDALYECVAMLERDPETEFIYTDEDKVSGNGRHFSMPHFKSDFNIDLLRSMNYINHFTVVKRSLIDKAGMLDPAFDGAQDHDFILRCTEKTDHIQHIPRVLYHWRAYEESTADNPESKNTAFEAGVRAVQAHLDRMEIPGKCVQTQCKGVYRVKYALTENPLVSVIIPNKDHIKDLSNCIDSLSKEGTYPNLEIIVVENNSVEEETFNFYSDLERRDDRVRVVTWPGTGFNYPSINNYGVVCSKGEYILLLNNDTEIIDSGCIEEMLSVCVRREVGAVGARLYFEDGTIQHAGTILGLGGVAGHAFVNFPGNKLGYFRRIIAMQDLSACTAACLMVKREVYEEVGGLDEKFAVAFNDIDLCMKIRSKGYLIVYDPFAELYHYESKSRGYEDTPEKIERFNSEVERFRSRWHEELKAGDPYYNPNLTLDRNDFTLNNRIVSYF